MRNLSDLFGGKANADVAPEKRSLDDNILSQYMDQESYLNPPASSTSVCMFDGPVIHGRRPRKRKACEDVSGHSHRFVRTFDVDFRRCHGDAFLGGSIALTSVRRSVDDDHNYYVMPVEIPDDPVRTCDQREMTVRLARKSVKRAISKINSRPCRRGS